MLIDFMLIEFNYLKNETSAVLKNRTEVEIFKRK